MFHRRMWWCWEAWHSGGGASAEKIKRARAPGDSAEPEEVDA